MAFFTFIVKHDLADKLIYLFCFHGIGRLVRSVQDITDTLPDSNILENVFDAYAEDTVDSEKVK